MMEGLVAYWRGLAQREQLLVGVMGVLLAVVILWLAVVRPVNAGIVRAVERHDAALDRNMSVRDKVAALKAPPAAKGAGPDAPLAQLLSESAGEAGLTLDRNQEQGPGRAEIAIASARPPALFSWVAGLEARGVVVENLTAQPAGTAGTISVQAVMKGRDQ